MNSRASFPDISPRAWEHPADAAALAAFSRIPGAAELLRRIMGSTAERSLRLSALGGAARVSEGQFPQVHRLVVEAGRVLDLSPLPEVFVRLGTSPEASTVGVERPFILLSSAALDFWSEDELLSVIGHEMGHILSGHAIYKTLLMLVLKAQSFLGDGFLSAAALAALTSGLREWDRKSELSADRAGLLAVQDPQAVYRALMKTAGGPRASEMDLNEFFRQAQEYDAASEGLDSLLKLLDVIGDSHPFPSVRMVALQEWERGGGYDAVRHGNYPKRSEDSERDPSFADARDSYARDFSSSQDPLSRAAGAVMDALGGILGGTGLGGGGQTSRPAEKGGEEPGKPKGPSVEDLLDDLFRKG